MPFVCEPELLIAVISNVDRLISICLLPYPDKFLDIPQDGDTGSSQTFHRDKKRTPWNSDDARETKPWGYSYDVLHHRSEQKDEQYLPSIRKAINEHYGMTRKDLFKFPDIHGKKNDYIVDIIHDL